MMGINKLLQTIYRIKMTIKMLPKEIMNLIVHYTWDLTVANTLVEYISPELFNMIEGNYNLIYGYVQSGKTKQIIESIRNNPGYKKVVVIQNLSSCLAQYNMRFANEGVNYQVVNKETTNLDPSVDVYLVMGNQYRYEYFIEAFEKAPFDYVLIVDEVDLVETRCPLIHYNPHVVKQVHVTATPYKLEDKYDRIIKVPVSENYYGLNNDKLTVSYEDDYLLSTSNFLRTQSGILLINRLTTVVEMKMLSSVLSITHPNVPVILLSNDKRVYLGGHSAKLRFKNVSKIIDQFINCPHIIFVANRFASRTISYVSSDFSRHLTHQISKIKSTTTNFLQSLRICGIYNDHPQLNLILPSFQEEAYEKICKKIRSFSVETKLAPVITDAAVVNPVAEASYPVEGVLYDESIPMALAVPV
jgi:hypothetical protein